MILIPGPKIHEIEEFAFVAPAYVWLVMCYLLVLLPIERERERERERLLTPASGLLPILLLLLLLLLTNECTRIYYHIYIPSLISAM